MNQEFQRQRCALRGKLKPSKRQIQIVHSIKSSSSRYVFVVHWGSWWQIIASFFSVKPIPLELRIKEGLHFYSTQKALSSTIVDSIQGSEKSSVEIIMPRF